MPDPRKAPRQKNKTPISLLTDEALVKRFRKAKRGTDEFANLVEAAQRRNLNLETGQRFRPTRPVTPQIRGL